MSKKEIDHQDRAHELLSGNQSAQAMAVIIPVEQEEQVKELLESKNVKADFAYIDSTIDGQSMMVASHREITAHHGPLPDPQALQEYEHILPGGAERIFSMAELQLQHRLAYENQELNLAHGVKNKELEIHEKDMEEKARLEQEKVNLEKIRAEQERDIRKNGQIFAFVLLILFMLAAAFFFYIGNDLAGGLFMGTALLGVIAKFIPILK